MATADRLEYVLAGRDELTKPLRQAEGQMKRLGNQAQRTNKQMGAFSSNLANAQKGTRAFAMGSLQQAGYQVGDFAVQIANGTNKMQAFGQQAPQFLQIFGPIGSVVGAAVAVFAAAAVMIEKTQATAENLSKSVDKATASIRAFSQSAKSSNKSVVELSQEYGMMAAQAKEFFEVQNEINRLVAFRDVAAAIEMATNAFGDFGDTNIDSLHRQGLALDDLEHKLESLSKYGEKSIYFDIERSLVKQIEQVNEELNRMSGEEVTKLSKELGISGSLAAILAEELQKAQAAENLDDRVKGLVKVRQLYKDIALADGEISDEEQKRLNSLLAAQMSYLKISSTLKEIRDATSGGYEDILGSESGLQASTKALNEVFESRLGTIDDTANEYVDILGSERGLAAAVAATNAMYAARLGTIDKTANEYVDVLGSEQGLKSATEALNQLYEDRLKSLEKAAQIPDPLGDLSAQIKLNQDLLGATDARRQVMQAIFQSERNYTPQQIEDTIKQIDAYNKQVKEMERIKSTAEMIGSAFENAFMSMIDGTKSAKDAFKDLTRSIIADLYRQYVVKQITGFISSAISFGLGPKTGNTGSFGLPKFDGGGYTGGGARSGGLDGKGGFMAMLHPRETVVDHTKGQGAGGVVVNQTINVSTGVQQTVRTEIKSLMPQIAESAKSAVMDAKRRGGSYGRSFA